MRKSRVTKGTPALKSGFASMFKGGVIMDVVSTLHARVAEEAGAVSVMALERVPADIRRDGGVARMTDPALIKAIQKSVTIPVMAKCRIGHFAEARVLEAIGVDFIDESEVLTPADTEFHIEKKTFSVPFVCGARNLGEALRRINEGAAMIRTKGEAGTGDISEAVRHVRTMTREIDALKKMSRSERKKKAVEYRVPIELVERTASLGRMPVVNFAAGGIATPADAVLVMQLGVDGVFVGSGIFKSKNPKKLAHAIVDAVAHFTDASYLADVSEGLGELMRGVESATLSTRLADRGN